MKLRNQCSDRAQPKYEEKWRSTLQINKKTFSYKLQCEYKPYFQDAIIKSG